MSSWREQVGREGVCRVTSATANSSATPWPPRVPRPQVLSTAPCAKVPANLPAGCTALRCELSTASGRPAVVILGGQQEVLREAGLVEYALRMTLVSDSLSLQFRWGWHEAEGGDGVRLQSAAHARRMRSLLGVGPVV